MLGGAALFAVMATCVALAHARDPGLSTFVTSTIRSAVNLLVLVAISAPNVRTLWGDGRPALWARGASGGVALVTYFACIHRLSAGEAAFLNQTSAIWVVAAAPFVLKERPSPLAWVAVVGSMFGIGLLSYPRAEGGDWLGRALGLISGLSAAAAYISIRKAAATNKPVVVVFYFTFVSTIVSALLAYATDAAAPADMATAGWLVGAGVSATVAQLLMTEAYRIGDTAAVAAAGAAGPLLTALAGWWALRQAPDGDGALGMFVLLVTSVALPFWSARGARPETPARA